MGGCCHNASILHCLPEYWQLCQMLNPDEAAVQGAAYHAATISTQAPELPHHLKIFEHDFKKTLGEIEKWYIENKSDRKMI